jgi:hypothetical protein
MTDKELLELAAKAADIELWHEDVFTKGLTQKISQSGILCWNPLADDGDAFRLAVKLGVQITIILDGEDGDHPPQTMVDWATEEHPNDPCAATRRAVVRAAAEIGKAKCE